MTDGQHPPTLTPEQLAAVAANVKRHAELDARHAAERAQSDLQAVFDARTLAVRKRLADANVDIDAIERELKELHQRDPGAARDKATRFVEQHREILEGILCR